MYDTKSTKNIYKFTIKRYVVKHGKRLKNLISALTEIGLQYPLALSYCN